MQVLSLVWGILAIIGFFIAFLPCLGSLNWLNIPFAGLGIIVSIIALTTGKPEEKSYSVIALVLCGIAVFIGMLRLLVGGGVL